MNSMSRITQVLGLSFFAHRARCAQDGAPDSGSGSPHSSLMSVVSEKPKRVRGATRKSRHKLASAEANRLVHPEFIKVKGRHKWNFLDIAGIYKKDTSPSGNLCYLRQGKSRDMIIMWQLKRGKFQWVMSPILERTAKEEDSCTKIQEAIEGTELEKTISCTSNWDGTITVTQPGGCNDGLFDPLTVLKEAWVTTTGIKLDVSKRDITSSCDQVRALGYQLVSCTGNKDGTIFVTLLGEDIEGSFEEDVCKVLDGAKVISTEITLEVCEPKEAEIMRSKVVTFGKGCKSLQPTCTVIAPIPWMYRNARLNLRVTELAKELAIKAIMNRGNRVFTFKTRNGVQENTPNSGIITKIMRAGESSIYRATYRSNDGMDKRLVTDDVTKIVFAHACDRTYDSLLAELVKAYPDGTLRIRYRKKKSRPSHVLNGERALQVRCEEHSEFNGKYKFNEDHRCIFNSYICVENKSELTWTPLPHNNGKWVLKYINKDLPRVETLDNSPSDSGFEYPNIEIGEYDLPTRGGSEEYEFKTVPHATGMEHANWTFVNEDSVASDSATFVDNNASVSSDEDVYGRHQIPEKFMECPDIELKE